MSAMAQTDAGLEVFFPIAHIETVGGREIAAPPLKVRQYAAFQAVVQPIIGYMVNAAYLDAVTHQTEACCRTVVVATGVDPEWLGEQDPDDLMRLLAAVCEVQIDFFVRRLRPAQDALGERTRALMAGLDGPPPLPGLSGTDTALPSAPI